MDSKRRKCSRSKKNLKKVWFTSISTATAVLKNKITIKHNMHSTILKWIVKGGKRSRSKKNLKKLKRYKT